MLKHFSILWVKILDNMLNLYANIYSLRKKKRNSFSWLICYAIIISSITSNLFANELPDLGNSANAALSPVQEYELGRSVMKELKSAMVISQDVIVNEYLQGLGYRLIATQGKSQPEYYFFAVKDKSINAFALPGGFVGVNTGLITATDSESELAGVIAHEVGHVQQKHIARMYEHMGRLRLSTIAGVIASVILATQNAQAGSGALAATLASNQQALINFTREHEKEADYVGIHTLAKAGFDPVGMPTFFHRMYQDTRYYGNHIPEYLLTHPLTEARLMAAQTRANSFPYRQVQDSLQYHLIQARVTLYNFSSAKEASNHFAKKLQRKNYRSRAGTLYGYALSLIEEGKPFAAKPYLDELIEMHPDVSLFQLAYAQMEMASQEREQAISRVANALKNHPNNYALIYIYSEWLIKTGAIQTAIRLLKQQVLQKPIHPELWKLLSNAYAQAHLHVQAHLAQAQFLKTQGDYTSATLQLTLAKKVSALSDPERRQIEAQMEEIKKKSDSAK